MNSNCDIGTLTKNDCNKKYYTTSETVSALQELDDDSWKILNLRLQNIVLTKQTTICEHHKLMYLNYFPSIVNPKCCDPYNKHSVVIKNNLRMLTLEFCEKFKKWSNLPLIPGEKVCTNCLKTMNTELNNFESNTSTVIEAEISEQETSRPKRLLKSTKDKSQDSDCSSVTEDTPSSQQSSGSVYTTGSQSCKRLGDVLNVLEMPALKKCKGNMSKSEAEELVNNIQVEVVKNVETTYGINLDSISTVKSSTILENSNNFQSMIVHMQDMFNKALKVDEKIEILKCLPRDWTLAKIKKYFDCSKHMFKKLAHFRKSGGMFI